MSLDRQQGPTLLKQPAQSGIVNPLPQLTHQSYLLLKKYAFSKEELDEPEKKFVILYKVDLNTGYLINGNKESFKELRKYLLKELKK